MFIKTQGFKRLIQEAYKMACLKVGRDEDGIYIAGGYWVLQVKDEKDGKHGLWLEVVEVM